MLKLAIKRKYRNQFLLWHQLPGTRQHGNKDCVTFKDMYLQLGIPEFFILFL
jgi:hypothetical protein